MKSIYFLTSLILLNGTSFAQYDSTEVTLPDESIDSPTINLEGNVKAPKVEKRTHVQIPKKELSPSEKMRLYREQMEIRNQLMVQKKIEQIRLKQELALAKKLEDSMNQTIQNIDKAMK